MFHTSDGRKVIENLDEFDDAREVVAGLAAEYQACERADYVSLLCVINMQSCMEKSMRITCKDCCIFLAHGAMTIVKPPGPQAATESA